MRFLSAASALALALCAFGHPAQNTKAIHRRNIDLSGYRLQGGGEYSSSRNSAKRSLIFSRAGGEDYVQTAKDVVKDIAPGAKYRIVDDDYVGSNGVAHVNFRQVAHDMDIDNANINVNVDKNGKVLSYGNSFYKGEISEVSPLEKPEYAHPVSALKTAAKKLGIELSTDDVVTEGKDGVESYTFKNTNGALTDPTADLVYLILPNNTLSLVWKIETDMDSNWYLTYVDAKSGEVVQAVMDYVADAKYEVYPWGLNDPSEGSREIISDPWDDETSEFTWHGDGEDTYKTLRGNNAIAQANPSGTSDYLYNYRPNSTSLEFVYPYPNGNGSRPSSYIDASITQVFYTANRYHDLLYQLGFDEKAGNFETNNNGDGGKGNDYVILNAQDGSGTDNANFATPPDGLPGRMRMYIWTSSNPPRDGAMEAGIVIHEYTHGLSNRLTGGPANSGCLQTIEGGGMGEGWSDFFATAVRLKPGDTRKTDYTMGAWAANNPGGIREFPYSTSMSTNPLTYERVNNLTMVHEIGTVWASMLNEVMWNLIDKHGKSDKHTPEFKDGVPTDGKFLSMKTVLDGLALQPCNPDFLSARDAILDADRALTGGDNQCEIWKGFAKRGLGELASNKGGLRKNSFFYPKDVC